MSEIQATNAAAPSNPPIADEIMVAFPDGWGWFPNPERIMASAEPAWARLGEMRKVYQELKARRISWLKRPAKERAKIEARPRKDIKKLMREGRGCDRVMIHTDMKVRLLHKEAWAEIGDMTRRLTGKAVVRNGDVVLLLTARCGLSLAEATSTEREIVAALLFAMLPAPADAGEGKEERKKPPEPAPATPKGTAGAPGDEMAKLPDLPVDKVMAAVLGVLKGATQLLIQDEIAKGCKLFLNNQTPDLKTIRPALNELRSHQLTEQPKKKKGERLTPLGVRFAEAHAAKPSR